MHGGRWQWGTPFPFKNILLQEQGQNLDPKKYIYPLYIIYSNK